MNLNYHTDQVFNFPSIPEVVANCMEEIYKSEVNFDRIAKLMYKDVALVAAILRRANSASYEIGKETSDLTVAMLRLGFVSVIQILISQAIEHIFPFEPIHFFDMNFFLEHSLCVSQIAFEIGKLCSIENMNDLIVASLMHDIGLLARIYLDRPLAHQVINYCQDHKTDFYTAEQKLNLVDHVVLGHRVLQAWRMPENVLQIVAHQHNSQNSYSTGFPCGQFKNASILNLSDQLAHRAKKNKKYYFRNPVILDSDLDNLGITRKDIKRIISTLKL